MIKEYCSIVMMSAALVILLGHSVIPHHHHDFEQHHIGHHHADGHSHSDDENESEDFSFSHFFSAFHHGENGITFLNNHNFNNTLAKVLFPFPAGLTDSFIFQDYSPFVRQNSPPYKVVYFNSQYFLPSGLRAPPTFIA